MLSMNKTKSVVGLDIEAGSIAATEIRVNGRPQLAGYGVAPLESGAFREGEVADAEALGDALKELFARNKLSKNVRLGIANQRVAVRTLRLPQIDKPDELETAIRFQAQDHIPMPLDQAVLDWQVVSQSVGEGGERHMEVVVVAARRDMLSKCMEALRRAGLRPVGIDHSAFGMIRAVAREPHVAVGAGAYVEAPAEATLDMQAAAPMPMPDSSGIEPAPGFASAKLYCNLGDITNLAVARGSACLFARAASFGVEGIAQKLAERRSLTLEHARQWLTHVGLQTPVETLEGDPETITAARTVLTEGVDKLADELRLSLEYFGAQDGALPIEGVVACGAGTAIPGLVERMQVELGQPFELGRPHALDALDDGSASRLTLSYGLALEE
jgi:type IV pilus assembly protein PilM